MPRTYGSYGWQFSHGSYPFTISSSRRDSSLQKTKSLSHPFYIRGILGTNLETLLFDKALSLYKKPGRINFAEIGQKKTALFLNNCDRLLYFGGQDPETANYIALRTNKQLGSILQLAPDKAVLLVRGEKPRITEKYDLNKLEAELSM